jgi:tetratricopeptide (TPR) repeat protein
MTDGLAPQDSFRMAVLEAPTGKAKAKLNLEVSSLVQTRLEGPATPAKWSERIVLHPRSGLRFRAMIKIAGEKLPTGIYKLKFRSLLTGASGKEIPANNDTFIFEVRSVNTFEDQIEMLRRQAMHLFTQGAYPEADQKLNELLKFYPNSSVSYIVKGHIAMSRNKRDEAANAYKKALDLLRTGADAIYSSYASRVVIEDTIGNLTATLRSLQQNK